MANVCRSHSAIIIHLSPAQIHHHSSLSLSLSPPPSPVSSHSCLSLVSTPFWNFSNSKRFFTSNACKKFIRVLFFHSPTQLYLLLLLFESFKAFTFRLPLIFLYFFLRQTLLSVLLQLPILGFRPQPAPLPLPEIILDYCLEEDCDFWVSVRFHFSVCVGFQSHRH